MGQNAMLSTQTRAQEIEKEEAKPLGRRRTLASDRRCDCGISE